MKNNMNIDEISTLREYNYPNRVDVVAKVMQEVKQRPIAVPKKQFVSNRRIVVAIAATVATLFIVFGPILGEYRYNEQQMGQDLAYFYSVDFSGSSPLDDNITEEFRYNYGFAEMLFDEYEID